MQSTIKKTLIIRFSSVGDVVLSSLLLRVFRKKFPDAQVDYLIKSEYADLVRHNPHISKTIEYPSNTSLHDLLKLRRQLHTDNYDLVVDIHGSLRSRFLTWGIPNVVRFNKRKLARFLLVKFKINAYERFGGAPSVALRYIEPVADFGVADDGEGLECFFPDESLERVEQVIKSSGISATPLFIGICPSAKHNTKMWLKARFAETADHLLKKEEAAILLFGSSGDEERRCNEIGRMIKGENPQATVINLAGKLSLLETAAALDKCALVLSNDSGLMHIAAARRKKVVAIFGSTVKELGFFPFGTKSIVVENNQLDCRPCTHIGLSACPKGHFKCMNDISTDHVVQAALQKLRN
jgi:heptosyltransferase-2